MLLRYSSRRNLIHLHLLLIHCAHFYSLFLSLITGWLLNWLHFCLGCDSLLEVCALIKFALTLIQIMRSEESPLFVDPNWAGHDIIDDVLLNERLPFSVMWLSQSLLVLICSKSHLSLSHSYLEVEKDECSWPLWAIRCAWRHQKVRKNC